MSVWDDAQKLESAEGSVWDQAIALEEPPTITEETPDEAFKTGVRIQDMSVELELPIDTIEENYDNLLDMEEGIADPTDIDPYFEPEYIVESKIEFNKVAGEQAKKELAQEQQVVSTFLAEDKIPTKVKIASLSNADLNFVSRAVGLGIAEKYPDDIEKIIRKERLIRHYMDGIRSMSEVQQAAMISALNFTNLFNLPKFTSRKGINPAEFITGKKGHQDAAIEAAVRVLAAKNEIDPVNIARLANIGATVGKLALEFWMTPGVSLAKAPAALQKILQTGAKFAVHEAIQAPREGETPLQRTLSTLESGGIGLAVGGAGKFIPSPFVRVPALVTGLGGLTYARTGDIEAAIETGVLVLGFEAMGLMQRAGKATTRQMRNTFANKAVKEARLHNPDLRNFTNRQVGEILEKQVENWNNATNNRNIMKKQARADADRALKLKKQGDSSAWDKMMVGRGFGQAAGVKPPEAVKPAEAPAKAAGALPGKVTPTAPTKVTPKVAKGLEAKPEVISAIVRIDGKVFEGTTHAQAAKKAIDAGVAQFNEKGILEKTGEPTAEIESDLFKTSEGKIVNRLEARKLTGGKMFAEAIKTIKPLEAKQEAVGKQSILLTNEEVNDLMKESLDENQYNMYLQDVIKTLDREDPEAAERAFNTEAEVMFERGFLYNSKENQWARVSAGFKKKVEAKQEAVGKVDAELENLRQKHQFNPFSETASIELTIKEKYEHVATRDLSLSISERDFGDEAPLPALGFNDSFQEIEYVKDGKTRYAYAHNMRGIPDQPVQSSFISDTKLTPGLAYSKMLDLQKAGESIISKIIKAQPTPTEQRGVRIAKEVLRRKIARSRTESSRAELQRRLDALGGPEPPPDVTPKQIKEVAEKLPEAEISQKPVTVGDQKFYPVTLPTEKIGVDPKKFQFKLGAKLAGGVTTALKDVEAFDPVKAGQILVWQNKAGKYFVVDGHHRVALAKKTGAETLQTWVLREADGVTAADARAIGALRNLADGKGTAVDAAKLFRDSDITLEKLKKQGVPTNNPIVQQGLDMKNLSDYVFRLVVDEKLPANFAAPIGRQVKNDAQQKQVADLILEGEVDTVRQAELLAATIDSAPILTTTEQTLFGLETTEKSLFAERAKVLANVEKRLKTNKKVFGVLATQTGIIEAKGNILQKVENLAAKEKAEEVLFMLEKLANSKGPIAEALNDATKEYGKNPTKETLSKVTSRLLQQWTEGASRLRVPDSTGVQPLPLERAGQKAVEAKQGAVEEEDIFKVIERDKQERAARRAIQKNQQWIVEPGVLEEIIQGNEVNQILKEKIFAVDANSKFTASFQTAAEFGVPTRVVVRDQNGKFIGEAPPFKGGMPLASSKQRSRLLDAVNEIMNEKAFTDENPVVTVFLFNEGQRIKGSKTVRSRVEELQITKDPLVKEAIRAGISELRKHEGETWADEALDRFKSFIEKAPKQEKLDFQKLLTEKPPRIEQAAKKPLGFETPAPELFTDPKEPTEFFGGKRGGFIDFTPLAKTHEAFMSIIEPSKAVEITQGKDVYAEVIKAIHKPDVAMIDFNEKELESLDSTLGEWGKSLAKYPNRILELLMLSRGKPASEMAIEIHDEALKKLAKEAPELIGTRKMITRAADFNYDYLVEVVGDQVRYIDDYFYGVYKDPRLVDKFLKHWKTTKRFTKQKKLPTVADAKAFGLELRHLNPVDNLRAEYMAIARLDGMIELKDSLMKSGEGDYIANTAEAPIDWNKVQDPVFADVRVAPELALMINNLISTNKITRQPILNTVRQINNFLRTIKFVGSAFHLGVEAKQALADSGYLGFLHKPTGTRGLTLGFKQSDPIFQTPEYRDYLTHGGGHRFSIDSEAQRTFTNAIDKLGKAGLIARGVALPFQIPEKFVRWMFENYIPKVKYSKYLDTVSEQEKKLGRSLKSSEKIDIVKEAQNFYGMMNERLFGRSGTVTTALRLKFMAPGFAEGNFRTILKSILQWGGDEGFSAHRSRSNIINSFIITAIAATVGTIFLTGKPPKKPEKLADLRDLFKIDTGKVDSHGRRIMIDLLTYDKDYWDVFGSLATGQPGKAISTTVRRLGGMGATTWDVMSDINQMSMGKAVYDWKGDRVVEITDPFIQKVLKLSIHELKKAQPISTNVFQQARKKGVGVALSAAMTLIGVRLTKSEQDKREMQILNQIWSLRDQQEALFWYLGGIKNPREAIKKYNQTVMRILDNPITPLSVKDEFEPKLIIDEKRLMANKVHSFLGDQAKLAELRRSPEKHQKEIKELQDDSTKGLKWLRNFDITDKQYKSHLVTYEKLHRKILKEIQPEDDQEELKNDLAKFYADQTILKRKIQAGIESDRDRRQVRKFAVISDNIAKISRRIYDTEDDEMRDNLFRRIRTTVDRID